MHLSVERGLKLVIQEADGELNATWVAVHPIRPDPRPIEGSEYEWPGDDPEEVGEFFKQYIIENWEGISGNRDPAKEQGWPGSRG
jgi:hypothetical protein